jgi:hypothetical protein
MNRFLNFKTASRIFSLAVYAWVIFILAMDSFRSSSDWSQGASEHHMTWWILFLLLDMWLFRKTENSDK